jgi:Cd2+/Zn2+-exporting ATPase
MSTIDLNPSAQALPNRARLVLAVEGLASPGTEQAVEQTLARLPGVAAKASHADQIVRVEFDRSTCAVPEIVRRLDALGLRLRGNISVAALAQPARPLAPGGGFRPADLLRGVLGNRQLAMALVGGVLLLGAFGVHHFHGPTWLRIALIIPAYFLTGWFTFIDTAKVLWELRFDIDVLMFAAAFGAAALGHYEEGGLLLLLFALGGAGEEMAMDRARRAIAALAKLAPETATVRNTDGEETLVRVADLKLGDEVIVRPFDRLPADGKVISGASAVDQSPITGESVPIEKAPGDGVFAGTINGEGMLAVAVTKLASETTLAKIVRLVEEAQASQSPTQQFTRAVEKRYVPLVLIGTAVLILLPPAMGGGAWAVWFYRAMAFLTAASPCALAIGTPAAVLSGLARAARGGVLIKGGAHLENLGRVRAIAFDKTGTLTRGRPELTDVVVLDTAMSEIDVLSLAAAVERHSSHPLAQAIVAAAQARGAREMTAEDLLQVPAAGVTAKVNGRRVAVGKLSLMPPVPSSAEPSVHSPAQPPAGAPAARAAIERLAAEGKTTVVVIVDGEPRAVMGLADLPRGSARDTLARLHRLGVNKTIMLTGDHAPVAAAVAKQLDVDEHYADLLPEDKLGQIKALCDKYGYVAMVGDGVNDAPAMAAATVGIAMGGAGTDVALETADVALMADDLAKLPEAIGLSRFSRRIISQNLVIALGVIAVLAPVAALGYAKLGLAVLFHEGSTVVVVLNSLRLLVYRERRS